MAIYEKPTWQLMREMADELLRAPSDVLSKGQAVEWFRSKYPKLKQGTIEAHLIRMSTNVPVRHHYNAKPGQDDLFYRIDTNRFRRYDPMHDPQPIYDGVRVATARVDEEIEDGTAEFVGDSEFAYESDLRDYLARNLGLLEPGLKLYESEGISGLEFPAGGRLIDILAVDSSGALVVIELKVSRGYDRVVGQLMRYMGWVREKLADEGVKVRGMIVAREISEDLKFACSEISHVDLYEYKLSMSIARVDCVKRNR